MKLPLLRDTATTVFGDGVSKWPSGSSGRSLSDPADRNNVAIRSSPLALEFERGLQPRQALIEHLIFDGERIEQADGFA